MPYHAYLPCFLALAFFRALGGLLALAFLRALGGLLALGGLRALGGLLAAFLRAAFLRAAFKLSVNGLGNFVFNASEWTGRGGDGGDTNQNKNEEISNLHDMLLRLFEILASVCVMSRFFFYESE